MLRAPEVLSSHDRWLRWSLVLGLLFLGGFGVRCLYVWGQMNHNLLFDHLTMDPKMHDLWARQIVSGQGLGETPFFRAPLYYYFLAMLYKVFGSNLLVGRLAGCVLGAATCVLVALLGQVVSGRKTGILAGLIWVIYWPVIYFDGELLSAGLEVFLDLLMLLLLLLAFRKASSLLYFLAGVSWGLSAITRPNVLAFAPFLLLWLWILSPKDGRLRLVVRNLLLIGTGAALCILPVTLSNYRNSGDLILVATNGGVNFFIGNNPESDGVTAVVPGTRTGWESGYVDTHRIADEAYGRTLSEVEVSDYWYGRALEWIRADPVDWGKLQLLKLRLFWSPHEIGNNQAIWPIARQSPVMFLVSWIGFPLIAGFAAGGVFLIRKEWREWFLLLAFGFCYMGTVVAFFCNARYRLPVVPILVLLGAAGVQQAIKQFRRREWRPVALAMLVTGLAWLLISFNPPSRRQFKAASEANHALQMAFYHENPRPQGSGDLEEAEKFFRKTLKLWPGKTEASVGLGKVLARRGEAFEAEKILRGVVENHPENQKARSAFARTLAQTGRTIEALHQFEELIKLDPGHAENQQALGCLLSAIGKYDEAVEPLREGLRLDPSLTLARECLDRAEEGISSLSSD